jgi:hypothetical protein
MMPAKVGSSQPTVIVTSLISHRAVGRRSRRDPLHARPRRLPLLLLAADQIVLGPATDGHHSEAPRVSASLT